MIETRYASAAEDALVPCYRDIEVGDGELEVVNPHDLGSDAVHSSNGELLLG